MFTVAFCKSQRLSGHIREYEFVTQTGQARARRIWGCHKNRRVPPLTSRAF
uniref:Uncharacterized protein n=1 Tax=Siphoviridae sp. ct3o911 TaxID=2827560 RepID=A0A8S5LJV7_9CAUD|nr:MAG TPA: hypothetical protein [Siphoviridae sp. ct3o911]